MKNFIFRVWLLGIALLMAGCGGGSSSSNDMAFTRVGANQYSYWPTGTYVIKTESDWSSAWDKNVTAYQPSQAQAKPAVDFSSSMLVGVAHENISCAVFGITRVVEESSQVRVEYAYSYLPPQTNCLSGGKPDFDLVKVAATSKPITFVRANVVPDSAPLCGVSLLTAGCSDVESLLPRDMEFTRVDSVMGDWPLGGLAYKTETEWNSAWDKHIVQFQHRQGVSEAPSTPSVDFSSSMLIGWSEWVQPCDWGGASITRVVEEATQVRVEYQYPQYSRLRPAEGVSCTAEYWVSPHFSFFKIAATSKPIVFVLTGVAPSLTLQK